MPETAGAETRANREERMFTLFGLRPSKAPVCPRAVAGLRCVAWHSSARQCVCVPYCHSVLDHGRMWINKAGQHVLTGEPYHLHSGTLLSFGQAIEALGLEFTIQAESPYFPGHTVLLMVEKRPPAKP